MATTNEVLSSQRVQTYRAEGWLVVPQLMPEATRQTALSALDALDRSPEVPAGYQPEHEPGEKTSRLRKLRRLVWAEPEIWRPILRGSGAAEVATQMLGAQATIIFNAAFLKPGEVGTEVALHQDQALWSRQYPGAFSIWFALSPVTEHNGCLIGCSGSHLRGEIPHRDREVYPWHPSLEAVEDALGTPVRITLQPGDAAMWDRYFVHGSEPNQSSLDRRGMVIVFADGGAPGFHPADRLPVTDLAIDR